MMLTSDSSWRESKQADGYYSRPDLDEGLSFYLQAFFELSSDRREALAQIPYTAIALYADRAGIAGDDFDRFKGLVRSLDGEFLTFTNRKMERGLSRGPRR
jgi:hypothetical protein